MKGICKTCGCSQNDCSQCIERTGYPCSWATSDEDECSACQHYFDSLEIFADITIRFNRMLNDLIKGLPISKVEYDHKLSLWEVQYTGDPDNNKTDKFAAAEDLLKFLIEYKVVYK